MLCDSVVEIQEPCWMGIEIAVGVGCRAERAGRVWQIAGGVEVVEMVK